MKRFDDCSHWREAIRAWVAEGVADEEHARVQNHLACCADCRRYAAELRAPAAGLRWLAGQEVEASPGFRARWTRVVEEAAQPDAGRAIAALAAQWRGVLLRNLRPALGVASLWFLALLFRLTAPDIAPKSDAAIARSPMEVARLLKTEQPLLVWQWWDSGAQPMPAQRLAPARPRSEGWPIWPAAQLNPEPDMQLAAGIALLRSV